MVITKWGVYKYVVYSGPFIVEVVCIGVSEYIDVGNIEVFMEVNIHDGNLLPTNMRLVSWLFKVFGEVSEKFISNY